MPNQQVAKSANSLQLSSGFFFRGDSTTMTETITMIQTRRSATGFGLMHPYHSVLKQIKAFSRDAQALKASACRYTPFCSIPFCVLNGGYAYTGNAALSTSCSAYDGPKVSCCSYVIIVRTLIQLLDHYKPYFPRCALNGVNKLL